MSQRGLSAAFWYPDGGDEWRIDLPVELNRPNVGSTFGSKNSVHEVISGPDVIQHLGAKALEYDLEGAIFPESATVMERYGELPRIRVRLPDRGTRDVVVKDGDISDTRTFFEDGGEGGDGAYLKEFSLTVVELNAGQASGGN